MDDKQRRIRELEEDIKRLCPPKDVKVAVYTVAEIEAKFKEWKRLINDRLS